MAAKRLLLSTAHSHSHTHSNSHAIPLMIRCSLQKPISQSAPQFMPKPPSVLATNLIKSYLKDGLVSDAREVFDEMPQRDVVAWTAMIEGYTFRSHHTRAWALFRDMKRQPVGPNAFTFSSVLKACKGMNSLSCGVSVHCLLVKHGVEGNVYVCNALMDVYAACCVSMDEACRVFQGMPERNDVSWTSLITGFTHRGNGDTGFQVFQTMLQEGEELNPFSLSITVRACASMGSGTCGRQIHALVIECGFESNLAVMNSVLDMYCRLGSLPEANQCFDGMSERNLITWNTLIAGYQRIDPSECLVLFSRMESEGFSPNSFTFSSVTAGCADLTLLTCGKQVHGGIIRRGFEQNLEVANALIDMYAKCGNIADSRKVFDELCEKNLVSWTSVMLGYGAHGFGQEAVGLFYEMVRSGIRPDRIVFMAILSACSHSGLVLEGLKYFRSMMDDHKVIPNQDIFGCVVDLLGRAGRVKEAYKLIQNMPFPANESVWGALLGACKAHGFPHLGNVAAQKVLDLNPHMVEPYIVLSSIYASEGKWGAFARTRRLIRRLGDKREAGRSWIEIRNQVYSFVVRDKKGSDANCVYPILDLLIWDMKAEAGFEPDFDCLIHDLQDGT